MDQDTLVENMRIMSDKIIDEHEQVNLIMLLGNDETDKITAFDYIISAKWLNEYSQEDGMEIVLDYFFNYVPVEDRLLISRITIIHTDDQIVKTITSSIGQQGGRSLVINCKFGNLIIPYALILESRFIN